MLIIKQVIPLFKRLETFLSPYKQNYNKFFEWITCITQSIKIYTYRCIFHCIYQKHHIAPLLFTNLDHKYSTFTSDKLLHYCVCVWQSVTVHEFGAQSKLTFKLLRQATANEKIIQSLTGTKITIFYILAQEHCQSMTY